MGNRSKQLESITKKAKEDRKSSSSKDHKESKTKHEDGSGAQKRKYRRKPGKKSLSEQKSAVVNRRLLPQSTNESTHS